MKKVCVAFLTALFSSASLGDLLESTPPLQNLEQPTQGAASVGLDLSRCTLQPLTGYNGNLYNIAAFNPNRIQGMSLHSYTCLTGSLKGLTGHETRPNSGNVTFLNRPYAPRAQNEPNIMLLCCS